MRRPNDAPKCRACTNKRHDDCRYGNVWDGSARPSTCECCGLAGDLRGADRRKRIRNETPLERLTRA